MGPEEKMRAVITQSNYIPWRGTLDAIDRADTFMLYDDVQYTRRDWRNRNRIKTSNGLRWLTIPVKVKGRYEQRIDEVEISDPSWAESHWGSIKAAYAEAPFLASFRDRLRDLYERAARLVMLTEVNELMLTEISRWLGRDTTFRRSSDFGAAGGQTERLDREH